MTRNTPERRRSSPTGCRVGRSDRHRDEDEKRRRRREEEEDRRRDQRNHRHRRSRSRSRSQERRRRYQGSSRGPRRRRSRSRSRRSSSPERRRSPEKERGAGNSAKSKSNPGNNALQVAAARAAALKAGGGGSGGVTPQQLIQQSLVAANEQAKAMTGIGLPSYYNPSAVNPLKYAEQMQKRKLLWQNKTAQVPEEKKPAPTCAQVWEKMTFTQDDDGKMTAKFRKLMGIKGDAPQTSGSSTESSKDDKLDPLLSKQEKIFRDLDQQYEMARISTHTQRGVGLGYSSQMAAMYSQFPVTK
ncbi:arginine/serine-rich coiled-coil protein 2-like [Ornithodoros turicata]|uniref:arginine/serine-rich coiled-coil protein 2-like n=1 Tax=Ornithodoros turicata TaxID=34597 RepID=UPI003138CEF8